MSVLLPMDISYVALMFCLQIEQFTSHILQSEKTVETPRLSPEELVYANEYVYFFVLLPKLAQGLSEFI